MAKPLQINRIDLLVHPFFEPGPDQTLDAKIPYRKRQGSKLLKVWKQHIDEVAKDPNRILLMSPAPKQTDWQQSLSKELVDYAGQRLGKRFGFFEPLEKRFCFRNNTGKKFRRFEDFLGRRFKVNSKRVKTRGFGEYTNSCVVDFLTNLNVYAGLENVIPYRNRQSTIIPRKSIGADFKPWDIKEMLKSPEGRQMLREKAAKYRERRRIKANMLAEIYWKEKEPFKPRTHLMKKKPRV